MDTPGFDDTHKHNTRILHEISYLLETIMYDSQDGHGHKRKTKLAGIVYLHDISLTRMLAPISMTLGVFQKLCGKNALKHVVLCTTKWSDISQQEEGESRTEQLKESHWKGMIEGRSTVRKFKDSQESAWDVIAPIIVGHRTGKMDPLRIQEEMVGEKKLIPETEAGRHLKYLLGQLLKSFKHANRYNRIRL